MDLEGYKVERINIYRSYIDSIRGVFDIIDDEAEGHRKYCEFLAALVEYSLDGVLPDWVANNKLFWVLFRQIKVHIDSTRAKIYGSQIKDKDIDNVTSSATPSATSSATPSATSSATPSATSSATPSTNRNKNKNVECSNYQVESRSKKDNKENLTEKENLNNINGVCSPKGEVTSPNGERKIFHYDKPNKKFTFGDITFKNKDVEQVAIDMLPVAKEISGFPFWEDVWANIASTMDMYKHKRLAIRMKHLLSEACISVADYVAYLENIAANHDLDWAQITSVHYINGSLERIKSNNKVRN